MFERGDVVAVEFPYSDGSGSKLRPALILSNEKATPTGDVVIIMITTHKREVDIVVELTDDMLEEPLLKPSFVKCHRLFAIATGKLKGRLSTVKQANMSTILQSVISIIS